MSAWDMEAVYKLSSVRLSRSTSCGRGGWNTSGEILKYLSLHYVGDIVSLVSAFCRSTDSCLWNTGIHGCNVFQLTTMESYIHQQAVPIITCVYTLPRVPVWANFHIVIYQYLIRPFMRISTAVVHDLGKFSYCDLPVLIFGKAFHQKIYFHGT